MGGQAQALRAARVDLHVRTSSRRDQFRHRGADRRRRGRRTRAWHAVARASSSRRACGSTDRNITDTTAASPWLLAEWQLTSDTRLRGGIAIQRQAPSIEQLALATSAAPLVPELARMFDLGVERRLGEAWRAKSPRHDPRRRKIVLRLVGVDPMVQQAIILVRKIPSGAMA